MKINYEFTQFEELFGVAAIAYYFLREILVIVVLLKLVKYLG